MKWNSKRLVVAAASLVVLFALASAPLSSSAETQAKTDPPPIEMHIMTVYSGYTYLEASFRSIQDNLNQTVTISPTTQAKQVVDQLGAKVQLQRWTGTEWIDVGPVADLSSANTSYFSNLSTKTTTSGYYYRGKVTHYAKEGSVTEQAIEYTDSILAQ